MGTLNEALGADDLVSLWPFGVNIRYGETAEVVRNKRFISVTRTELGMYERPIHYATLRPDTHPHAY